jgi:hypothetical protein
LSKTKKFAVTIFGITIVLLLFYLMLPKRTVKSYCTTYKEEKTKLQIKWEKELTANSNKGTLSRLIGTFGAVAGMSKDIEYFYEKLEKVSPGEIREDVKTLRDAAKKSSDQSISGNWFQDLAAGLAQGLRSASPQRRVDEYTQKNCEINPSLLAKEVEGVKYAPSPTTTPPPTPTPTPPALSYSGISDDSLKLWEKPQSGVFAAADDRLLLINPTSLEVIAQRKLPEERGRTPGGDSGKSYTLITDSYQSNIDDTDFDVNYRFIPLFFSLPTDNGWQGNYLGLYDLADNRVEELNVSNGDKQIYNKTVFFNPLNRNELIFQGKQFENLSDRSAPQWQREGWRIYDPKTKNIKNYELDINPKFLQEQSRAYVDPTKTDIPQYLWNKDRTGLTEIKTDRSIKFRYQAVRGSDGLGCSPFQFIDDTSVFCITAGNRNLNKLDISFVLNNEYVTDDPSDFNYQPGRRYYKTSEPLNLPSKEKPISDAMSILISPDGKYAVYHSNDLLYYAAVYDDTVPVVKKTITSLPDFQLLEWRE